MVDFLVLFLLFIDLEDQAPALGVALVLPSGLNSIAEIVDCIDFAGLAIYLVSA